MDYLNIMSDYTDLPLSEDAVALISDLRVLEGNLHLYIGGVKDEIQNRSDGIQVITDRAIQTINGQTQANLESIRSIYHSFMPTVLERLDQQQIDIEAVSGRVNDEVKALIDDEVVLIDDRITNELNQVSENLDNKVLYLEGEIDGQVDLINTRLTDEVDLVNASIDDVQFDLTSSIETVLSLINSKVKEVEESISTEIETLSDEIYQVLNMIIDYITEPNTSLVQSIIKQGKDGELNKLLNYYLNLKSKHSITKLEPPKFAFIDLYRKGI